MRRQRDKRERSCQWQLLSDFRQTLQPKALEGRIIGRDDPGGVSARNRREAAAHGAEINRQDSLSRFISINSPSKR